MGLLYTKLFKNINISFLLALCLSYYGIYFWGCVLRASIAITIGYLAFTILLNEEHKTIYRIIVFYILIFLASTFHSSSYAYAICPFLILPVEKRIRYLLIIASVFAAFGLNTLGLNSIIERIIVSSNDFGRFQGYLLREEENYGISFFGITSVAIAIFSTIRYKNIFNGEDTNVSKFFMNVYLVGVMLLTVTLNIPAGSRLGRMFTFFEFAVICYILKSYSRVMPRVVISFTYLICRFPYLIYSYPLFLNY